MTSYIILQIDYTFLPLYNELGPNEGASERMVGVQQPTARIYQVTWFTLV